MGLIKRMLSFLPFMAMASQPNNIHQVTYDPKVDFNRGNHSKSKRIYSRKETRAAYRARRSRKNENCSFASTKGFAMGYFSNPGSLGNL